MKVVTGCTERSVYDEKSKLKLNINSRRRADFSTRTLAYIFRNAFALLGLKAKPQGTRAGLSGVFRKSPPFDFGLSTTTVFDSSLSSGRFMPGADE